MTKPTKQQQQQNKALPGNGQGIFMAQQKIHSGPIPSAEELNQLERVLPGIAERIVSMAEKEQAHRHDTNNSLTKAETDFIEAETKLKFRGQIMALIGVILIVALCAYGFYLGFGAEAATIACGVIVALVGAFAYSRTIDKNKEKE